VLLAGRGLRPARALLDAINYIKAAWALHVPAALGLSRSGTGAQA
jgi:hypothetical protein